MVKLKMLSMHDTGSVPDHVLQEMQEFALKLTKAIAPLMEGVSPNVALAALIRKRTHSNNKRWKT